MRDKGKVGNPNRLNTGRLNQNRDSTTLNEENRHT